MARKPRIHYPGAVYHVVVRGNARQEIFFSAADRFHFLSLLQDGLERYDHRVHAFCLMPNHIHLAVQVGEVSLSRIMQNLCFRYTQWTNRRQDRVGHLFQGRYKAVLVDGDSYLLELVRYLHLNPVRAGMVGSPEEYPWSSHLAYLGEKKLPWLTRDWVLSQFSSRRSRARKEYREFVHSGKAEGHREEFHRGKRGERRVLGDDTFIEEVLSREERRVERVPGMGKIIEKVCHYYGVKESELSAAGRGHRVSEVRGVIAWLVLESRKLTLKDLSKRVNRDISTLSSGARRVRVLSKRDTKLSATMEELKHALLKSQTLQA
ncbi:MAG: transposase [Deltaproteobacteria bacterium SM23_61]|nr:MAG: transposase [Deltaproteobacteria bacterium SM23_61]